MLVPTALAATVLAGALGAALVSDRGREVLGLPVAQALPTAGVEEGTTPVPPGCDRVEDVRIAVGSDLSAALRVLDAAPLGPTDDGLCARPTALELAPAQAVTSLVAGRDGVRFPDVWIPDSSLWVARAQAAGVELDQRDSLGTTPVVVASSAEVVDGLGWRSSAPGWADVLAGTERPLAVADLADSAGALMAIDAAGQAAGDDRAALTARAALARQRAGQLTPSQGLAQAATEGPDAPLVITSEQDVLRRGAGAEQMLVVAVGPTGGTPVLDYPVVAVPPVTDRTADEQTAVDLVLTALASGSGRALAVEAGLRGPDLEPLPGVTRLVEVSGPVVRPDPERLEALAGDLTALAPPSQLLVVVDVSLSMTAEVGDGFTRADVASEALGRALADLPDSSRVGLWQFASVLEGEQDHREVLPVRALDSTAGGAAQRDLLAQAVTDLPESLVSGGTSLYDTVDAAVTATREQWDPTAVSTVVVITDGRNEDSTGLDLDDLKERLSEGADPERPVGLVLVGFGPDADLSAIEEIAAVGAGGPAQAVDARNPNALQSLLVQLLAARTAPLGTAPPSEAP